MPRKGTLREQGSPRRCPETTGNSAGGQEAKFGLCVPPRRVRNVEWNELHVDWCPETCLLPGANMPRHRLLPSCRSHRRLTWPGPLGASANITAAGPCCRGRAPKSLAVPTQHSNTTSGGALGTVFTPAGMPARGDLDPAQAPSWPSPPQPLGETRR